MTTQPVDGWTAGALLFDGDAAQALALRFDDPEVREALEAQTGPVGSRLLTGVLTQVAEAVAEMPSPDLSNVLVRAWTAHRDLRAAAAETCRPNLAEPPKPVELDPHEVTVTQHPAVDVTVNGRPFVTLRFELALVATVQGLVAVVRLGRLVAIESGHLEIRATLSVQGAPLARARHDFEAPVVVALGAGVQLFPPRQASRS